MHNTLYEFAARLDVEQFEVLRCRCLLAHSSRQPLRRVDPNMLEVEGIAGLGKLEFRSKFAKREQRGRVSYADKWAAALEDIGNQDDDEDCLDGEAEGEDHEVDGDRAGDKLQFF